MPKKEAKQIRELHVECTALPPMATMDLLGVAQQIIRALGGGGDGLLKFRDVFPKLCAGVTCSWTNEQGKAVSVKLNSVAGFDAAFDGRMRCLAPVIALAIDTSFSDFFDGVGDLGPDDAQPAEESNSPDSSPSISDTGSATESSSPVI